MNDTTAAPENNQVAIIENSIEVFRQGPAILKANQEKTEKALVVGRSIIQQWNDAWNIEEEDERINALAAADERSNKYLANCSTALKAEKEGRAVVTQIMNELLKLFTACENDIDNTKPNTIPAKVQGNRDQFAKTLFDINDRKRKEAERTAAKAKEAVELKATVSIRLFDYFNEYLLQKKIKLQEGFNTITLDGFADKAADLRQYNPLYSQQHFAAFKPNVYSALHSKEELEALIQEVVADKFTEFVDIYKEQMLELKQDLVDKLPSKRAELMEQKRMADEAAAEKERQRLAEEERQKQIASANAENKKRLEEESRIAREAEQKRLENLRIEQEKADAERKRREDEDAARMQKESDEAKKKSELNVEMTKQADQTMIVFDQEASLAENTAAPEARQGYDIVVTHQAGCVQLFKFWFENEGKNLPIDKMLKTSIDQMKTFCEKYAHKNNTKIESKFLKYEPSYKAINRKAVK